MMLIHITIIAATAFLYRRQAYQCNVSMVLMGTPERIANLRPSWRTPATGGSWPVTARSGLLIPTSALRFKTDLDLHVIH
jgi:hypothetical protein